MRSAMRLTIFYLIPKWERLPKLYAHLITRVSLQHIILKRVSELELVDTH